MSVFGKAAKAVGRHFANEVKATLSEDDGGNYLDWITPAGKIGIGVGGAIAGRVKTWSVTKKCIVCRSTPTCGECKKCSGHCKCEVASEEQGKYEWRCSHCDLPHPKTLNQCPNCGAARPETY